MFSYCERSRSNFQTLLAAWCIYRTQYVCFKAVLEYSYQHVSLLSVSSLFAVFWHNKRLISILLVVYYANLQSCANKSAVASILPTAVHLLREDCGELGRMLSNYLCLVAADSPTIVAEHLQVILESITHHSML